MTCDNTLPLILKHIYDQVAWGKEFLSPSIHKDAFDALARLCDNSTLAEPTRTEAIECILDVLPPEQAFEGAIYHLWHRTEDNGALRERLLTKAYESIDGLPQDQKFRAVCEIWNRTGTGSAFQAEVLGKAYDIIDGLPLHQQFGGALTVWHRAPDDSPLKPKAIERAFDMIGFLPPEAQPRAAYQVFTNASHGSAVRQKAKDLLLAMEESEERQKLALSPEKFVEQMRKMRGPAPR